ncbi:MAG: serine hydrolase [Bacteroidetes bacterium]|nr:serine hydrolase [Bacteroidota bacterium]
MQRVVGLIVLLLLGSTHPANGQTPTDRLVREAGKQIPSLAAFIVERHDSVRCQEYFHGATSQTPFNVKSMTKTFVSSIAGAARLRGLLPDLDTPFLTIMPEYGIPDRLAKNVWFHESPEDSEALADLREDDSLRKLLSLRQLMQMQAGFRYHEFGPIIDEYCSASDPVRFMIDLPFETEPGDTFNYCTGAAHMFGVALSRCVKTDIRTFADTALFIPAGIHVVRWATDPEGRSLGGSELWCTATDALRLGELYLHHGVAGGRQLLPSEWIDESWQKHAELAHWDVAPHVNGYGYYWWRRQSHGHQVYFASGYGGQLLCVIPDLDMVIVTICTLGKNNRGRSELRRLHDVIDRIVATERK